MKKIAIRLINGILCRLNHIRLAIYRPNPVKIKDNGSHNEIIICDNPTGNITIIMNGSNNTVSIGSNCKFYGERNCIYISGDNNNVEIGTNTTFDQRVLLVACEGSRIAIGEDCMFAANVTIRTSDQHPIYDVDGNRLNPAKDIKIDKHVWLGANVVIMKGLQIGEGTMVGYGSMVTKSLPENCLAVGSPAHVIKENISWERTFKK